MSITKFNINADFIAYQQITASGLSHLSGRAYKTEGGIFALCSKGSLKTIIKSIKNATLYNSITSHN